VIDIAALIECLRARQAERPNLDCDPDADIAWAESLRPPPNASDFALEIIFVICNSGMRFTTARGIYEIVRASLLAGGSAANGFNHVGKAKAIDDIWTRRIELYTAYFAADDKLAFIESLPWIGGITKYHVAKNFGLPYAKPDVHLQRLADTFQTTPQQLCEDLAKTSGYKVSTVDTLLWRAAACGVLDTRSGKLL
jgi:hypothetical protein